MSTVSAYEARTKLGDILNRVYYRGEEVVIERKGEPMVKIVKFEKPAKKKNTFLTLAGAWKDVDTTKMIEVIYKTRKDGSRERKFLLP